jgi:hypothetical protein
LGASVCVVNDNSHLKTVEHSQSNRQEAEDMQTKSAECIMSWMCSLSGVCVGVWGGGGGAHDIGG